MLRGLLQALKRRPAQPVIAQDVAAAAQQVERAQECHRRGDRGAAAALCRAALALDPRLAPAWSLLGRIALDDKQPQRALECYAQVLAIQPAEPDYLVDAAEINRRAGQLARALELADEALKLRRQDGRAWRVKRKALEELGRLAEAWDCLRHELELDPDNSVSHSDLLFLLRLDEFLPPPQVAAEHRRWGELHADRWSAAAEPHANPPEPDRLLRIGYVSADFRRHALAYFVEPVLAHHDRRRVRVHCYSNCGRPDEITQRLRALAHEWRDIAALTDDEAARLIRKDGIDILVDLSGHTSGNRLLLFARRPAPIQITWLGYLGGTGMAAMDLRISDAFIDPPGVAEPLYRERLARLPQVSACYRPPEEAPQVNALPALQRGYLSFGSFNSFAKLNDATKHAWAQLLARLPGARLRVVGVAAGEACDRMLEMFEREGVYADRIDVLGRLPYRAYLEQYLQVDIALDPYPYNGGTTTLESLWMGVPVITRAGSAGISRCTASYLSQIGLEHLIAGSWEEYLAIASHLARDLPRLAGLRADLRERLRGSALLDAAGFTAALEAMYRDAWQRWCAGESRHGEAC